MWCFICQRKCSVILRKLYGQGWTFLQLSVGFDFGSFCWPFFFFLLLVYPNFSTFLILNPKLFCQKNISKMLISQFKPLRLACNVVFLYILEKSVILREADDWVHSLCVIQWLSHPLQLFPSWKNGNGSVSLSHQCVIRQIPFAFWRHSDGLNYSYRACCISRYSICAVIYRV